MEVSPMEFSVEAAGPCRKRVKVTIPPNRVAQEFDKSYKNWIQSVPIPGFRPGKAPRRLVEKKFGEQVALEVKQSLLDAAFQEALEKNHLAAIADPEIDFEKISVAPEQKLDFDFVVTVKPEFELPDLKSIEVEAPSAEPTKAEVDEALEGLRRNRATFRPVADGTIAERDQVTLHIHGRVGGEEAFHQEALLYEVGSKWLGGLIPEGLDEALLGRKSGAKVTATASPAPQDEGHPFAGKTIDVEAEVVELKRPELPPIDDQLAKAYDYENLDAFLGAVRADVAARKESARQRAIEDRALQEIIRRSEFELPKEMIEREAEELARRYAYEMQLREATEEEIAKKVSEIRSRRAEETARELKSFFVLDKIVEKERILVTETEVKEAVAILGAYNGKSPEQMYAMLRESGRLGSLRNQLRERKARARLRERVKLKESA